MILKKPVPKNGLLLYKKSNVLTLGYYATLHATFTPFGHALHFACILALKAFLSTPALSQ